MYAPAGRAFRKAEYQTQANLQNAVLSVEERKSKKVKKKRRIQHGKRKNHSQEPSGLHLRPAGILSNIASKCVS